MSQDRQLTTATTTSNQPARKAGRLTVMSFKTRMLATFGLVVLTLGLFSSSRSVLPVNDCQKAKGNISAVNNGNGTTSGTITQGGILNGTSQSVFTSALTPTPDPNTFCFTDDLTITTNKGDLKTHNVTLATFVDAANIVVSALARIDPNASTGDFAGATGVLYINDKTTDGAATFHGEITGEICFAN